MKKIFFVFLFVLFFAKTITSFAEEKKILYYVDPMHPWYKSDKPGIAPDCGMDLTPVYEESGTTPSSMPSSLHLSSDKQQLIGVQTQEAQVRNLFREIESSGRVAYDPNLYLAQKEYLIALKNAKAGNPEINTLQAGMIRSSRSRLELLGMSPSQIQALQRSGRAQETLLRPGSLTLTWFYGSLYESDLSFVKPGQKVEIRIPGQSQILQSQVDSIDPVINASTRTAQFRTSLSNNASGVLRPDLFVKLIIQADLGNVLSVPDTAVLDSGKRQVVFVEKEKGVFEPREVRLGKRGTGFVEIVSGVSVGEKVVTQGNFLLDSESSLRGVSPQVVSPQGGHSH